MKDKEQESYLQFMKTCLALAFVGLIGVGLLITLINFVKFIIQNI